MNRADFRPSRQLAVLLTAMHILAGMGVLLLSLPLAWRGLLLIALAASLAFFWSRWRGDQLHFAALAWAQGGGIRVLARADDEWCDAVLARGGYVSSWLTVIPLRIEGESRPRHLAVLPDMLDADAYRRLRVFLRWGVRPD
jgi:toxin CptA